ncbi:MAG: hypothetical protein PWP23_2469 [Candidatus Sumerlaeota bacterium]|nr:hypothetical protein [Candidatus Sumerlaeota bacterium]
MIPSIREHLWRFPSPLAAPLKAMILGRERRRIARAGRLVAVYQMGKVGSTTVYRSLRHSVPDLPRFHVHFLEKPRIDRLEQGMREKGLPVAWHLEEGRFLADLLREGDPAIKWLVIAPTREPGARNLSAYFENIEHFFPDFAARRARGTLSVDELIDTFLARYHQDTPLTWFDRELKTHFGIDAYETPFPHEKGWQIVRTERVDVLVVRLEDFKIRLQPALADFLGTGDIVTPPANVSEDKEYADLYGEVRRKIVFPPELLDHLYESRYARHFYTDEERSRFRARWSGEGEISQGKTAGSNVCN